MVMAGICQGLGWYDNEWGYSNRLVDFISRLRVSSQVNRG